jgi:hypothetical protein
MPLTCWKWIRPLGLQPIACRGRWLVGSDASCRLCWPALHITRAAGRRPPVTWLSRGMDRPEVRVPVAGSPQSRDGRPCMITSGIDPHKSSLTALAVESPGDSVATMRITVTARTVRQLLEWAARWPQRRWAVEGARGPGTWRGLPRCPVRPAALSLSFNPSVCCFGVCW